MHLVWSTHARVEEGDQQFATIPLPVFKGAVLAHKKRALQSFDDELISAMKHLLHKTAATEAGDLVRWKLRRTLQALAEENSIKFNLPASPNPVLFNVFVADETTKAPTRRRKAKAR